ncbi:hypothetical protein ACFL6S_36630 [Candidatus Poribacteria bacterium]
METQVDIQMPIRKGAFVIGDAIDRLLLQDVASTFFVDAGEDFEFSPEQEELLTLVSTSDKNANRIRKSTKAAFKRNRLRTCGSSPYVYLADPDVLLPERPFFGSMISAFERNPQLGAVGLCYQESDHVACGSMMLRRTDFMEIGELKGTGKSCICGYIQMRFHEAGFQVIPLKTLRAGHLKSQYGEGFPEYETVQYEASSDGIIPRSFLKDTIQQHGTGFKLFVHS